jgi:hypothetical protein
MTNVRGRLGLKAIEWGPARRALARLGAQHSGTTAKHGVYTMVLPNGRQIPLGKASEPQGRAHRHAVATLLGVLEGAEVPLLTFLAVLDAEGGAVWVKPPPGLSAMREIVEIVDLSTPEGWREAVDRYASASPPEPEPEPEPVVEPEPELPIERWLVASEVVQLAGSTKGGRYRLMRAVQRRTPPFDALIDEGAIRQVPRPAGMPGRYQTVLGFTEQAAMAAAEWLAGWVIEEAGAPEMPQEAPQVEPGPQGPAPAVEAPAVALAKPGRTFAAPAEALLELCRWHGVEPVFVGFGIDVEATVLLLADSLHQRG